MLISTVAQAAATAVNRTVLALRATDDLTIGGEH